MKDDFAHDRSGVATWCWRSCIPEAIELAAWRAQRSSECLELPVRWPDEWLGYDHHGGSKGEPSFVSVSLTLLMAVLSYHAKPLRMPEIPLQPVRRGVRAGHHSRRSGGIPGLEAAHSVADTDSCTRSSGGSKDTRVLAFLGVMFEPSSVARVQTKV